MLTKDDIVAGVFDDVRQAEQAIADLYRAGFSIDKIDMVTRSQGETEGTPDFALQKNAANGTVTGAATGAAVGALAAAAIATLAIPGFGLVLGSGLLASLLGGGVLLGAFGGSLIGTFTALEMTEDDAKHYARAVEHEGRTVVLVQTPDRRDEARRHPRPARRPPAATDDNGRIINSFLSISTSPKRERGVFLDPRSRFGLVQRRPLPLSHLSGSRSLALVVFPTALVPEGVP